MMNTTNRFYLPTDFKFSDESIKYIKETYTEIYKDKCFSHQIVRVQRSNYSWDSTTVIQELQDFLEPWGIERELIGRFEIGPDLIISNYNNKFLGSPHIDRFVYPSSTGSEVITRFNVVIMYDPDDVMAWWEHDIAGTKNLGRYNVDESRSPFLVQGDTPEEQWNILGTPTILVAPYKHHAACFVKTDCAHAFNIEKPGFRIVVSVALPYTIEQLCANRV